MRFELKDKGLQKQLDEISDGDFSRWLNNTFYGRIIKIRPFTEIHFGQIVAEDGTLFHRFTVRVREDEIEEIPEYDPHKWNPYPQVTPPECVPMRVEFTWYDGSIGRQCGIFKNRIWEIADDPDSEIELVRRFRPWDDPDEEDEE